MSHPLIDMSHLIMVMTDGIAICAAYVSIVNPLATSDASLQEAILSNHVTLMNSDKFHHPCKCITSINQNKCMNLFMPITHYHGYPYTAVMTLTVLV